MKNWSHNIFVQLAVAALAVALVAGPAADARAQDDPTGARELYREAKKLLNADEYDRAADKFGEVQGKYPDSRYAAEALYWRAFSLYRIGGKSPLKDAQRALERQFDEYGRSDSYDDARALYYRVLGQLAEAGDRDAAEKLARVSEEEDWERTEDVEREGDCDLEEKMAAMHALLNMNPNRAYGILEKLYRTPKTDPCSAELREQALFLLSQVDNENAVDLLVQIARSDPSGDVREQAVFWLSQTGSKEATAVLLEILEESDDRELQLKAIFSLSQIGDREATEALRRVVMDESRNTEVRAQAIFWLGQQGGLEDVEFLKKLFGRLDDPELKEKVLFGVSQSSGRGGGEWLMSVVADESEDVDVRKQALFWAGQSGSVDWETVVGIYKTSRDRELREQAIFVLSQSGDRAAVKAMIELARAEKDRELRKQLLFWIGQSNHPEAEDYLMEVIND